MRIHAVIRAVLLIFIGLGVAAPYASAQLVANGKALTVTTTNSIATFSGADLVGFKNQLTNEDYLTNSSSGQLAAVNTIASTGQTLQTSNWAIANGQATITVSDSVRTLTLTVKIDGTTQETVITSSATISNTGLRDASWSFAGMNLDTGRLILPAYSGVIFDKKHSPLGHFLQYPTHGWNAQMGVYEGAQGSFVFYSTDTQMRFKQLRATTRGNSTIDLAVATEAIAPFTTANSVPAIEWRLKAFAGDWKVAAQVYRTWLSVNRPPTSNSQHPWVNSIRAVVGIRSLDQSVLAPLATKVVPSQTLLYIHDWRASAYDVNYPDYTPRSGVGTFITAAHNLGFKVMLHLDMIGVSPGNPDYTGLQSFQARTSESLQLTGWQWELPPGTPTRFAYINPASSAFRSLFIARVTAAVNAVHPDALHLDISSPLINDGNGPIEGLSYGQGAVQLHEDLIAAFPTVALGGEGENDVLYRYQSFAQAHWPPNLDSIGHPIATFLFNTKTQYYGHLGQPDAIDPAMKTYLSRAERRAVLPQLPVNGTSSLDTTNPDIARLIGIVQSWQTNAFQLDINGSWAGALVSYVGAGNTTAALNDSGTVESLTAAGATLYQLAHDAEQISTSTSFIPSWPAFDANTLFGLDPAQLYFLTPGPRPTSPHLSGLPAGVRVGPGTLVTPKVAHFELDPATAVPFDFIGGLLNAAQGVTFQGTDGPLANGASVTSTGSSVGNLFRPVLFLHPPFQGQIGGETFAQFAVPVLSGARFQFSVGIQDGAACNQDGVTFRVTVNGVQAYQQNFGAGAWHDGMVDLSAYPNSTVQLRIISNPGPQNNPNCDWGVWSLLNVVYPTQPALTSVPLDLGAGSIFSGMSGDGSYTQNSPGTATISNLPIPSRFTVFPQPGSAVVNGTNIATLLYEMLSAQHGGRIESAAGCCPVGSAVSGGVTKNNAIGAHPPSDGVTILAWVLKLPDTGSLRFNWSAGIRDGASSTDGIDFSVLVDGVSYWKLTKQNNSWVSGNIDLGLWRGKNILLELVTDSRAEFYFDWAAWADLTLTNSTVSCAYTLGPPVTIGAQGGPANLTVTTSSTCPWFVTSSAAWLTVTSGGSGVGTGNVSYAVAPNSGPPRLGISMVGGQVFIVTQADINGVLPKRVRSQLTSQ